MPKFNWKELQEEQMKAFDKKASTGVFGGHYLGEEVDWEIVQSHLLSSNQRSALAVIGALRERMPKKRDDKVYHYLAKNKRKSAVEMLKNDGFNDCHSTITKLLEELEAEVSK